MLSEFQKNSSIALEDSFSSRVWGLHQHVLKQLRKLRPLFVACALWVALASVYAAYEFFSGMRESLRWAPEMAIPFLIVMCGVLLVCAGVSIYRCLFVREWETWHLWQARAMLRDSSIAPQIADLTWFERLKVEQHGNPTHQHFVKNLQQYLAWSANWMPYIYRLSTSGSVLNPVDARRLLASTAVNALPVLPIPLGWIAITVGTICILALPIAWHRTSASLLTTILIFGFIPAIYLSVALVWMGWERIGAYARLIAFCEMLIFGPTEGPPLKLRRPGLTDFLELRRSLRLLAGRQQDSEKS
jgi:hypothetical protein